MCHVALGIVEAYWEYRLKPWDMAAGVLVSSTLSTIILKVYLSEPY
jgi:fructose-1,6-bisphosphatase/inositol monophosphatase family enzyme